MNEAFNYWLIGIQYLRLAEAACNELVGRENASGVVFIGAVDWDEYLEATKWSDHSIGIAILFNFFHGIEVLLKGFLSLKAASPPRHHRLSEILMEFEKEYPGTRLSSLVREYTEELCPYSPLGQFFRTNAISVDEWYEALKYPESKSGRSYRHTDLKYGGLDTVHFWKSIGNTAILLRKEAVQLSRSID
ncbi:hypothetical protein [Geothrix paludis]|uniref:hypothetical protein n=1 Tax=Geothrix paludis TaxID=2922722 RepID=UPI001FADC5FE|nr:hypothetical protein [Geothrix paludis]